VLRRTPPSYGRCCVLANCDTQSVVLVVVRLAEFSTALEPNIYVFATILKELALVTLLTKNVPKKLAYPAFPRLFARRGVPGKRPCALLV
jgi:hypothetical protein